MRAVTRLTSRATGAKGLAGTFAPWAKARILLYKILGGLPAVEMGFTANNAKVGLR
nr:MAG TPA: hypothetical protein [Inoviridae sp.]